MDRLCLAQSAGIALSVLPAFRSLLCQTRPLCRSYMLLVFALSARGTVQLSGNAPVNRSKPIG